MDIKIKNQHDYCPHTKYGESKVETEIRVWMIHLIVTGALSGLTSIWGPWFGVPYRNFFDMVMRRMYFHIGHIKCHKTYGYIAMQFTRLSSFSLMKRKMRIIRFST